MRLSAHTGTIGTFYPISVPLYYNKKLELGRDEPPSPKNIGKDSLIDDFPSKKDSNARVVDAYSKPTT